MAFISRIYHHLARGTVALVRGITNKVNLSGFSRLTGVYSIRKPPRRLLCNTCVFILHTTSRRKREDEGSQDLIEMMKDYFLLRGEKSFFCYHLK